jgi:hypothetical protein
VKVLKWLWSLGGQWTGSFSESYRASFVPSARTTAAQIFKKAAQLNFILKESTDIHRITPGVASTRLAKKQH